MSSPNGYRAPHVPTGADLVIDVGANQGDFSIEIAKRNPDLFVVAIEPIPALCTQIQNHAQDAQLDNVIVEQVAIDTAERESTFHVADHHDLGVSSLLPFKQKGISQDEYWKHREDLYFDKEITVKVRPLSAVLGPWAPRSIKFIKIDAQGLDIDVLDSLGPYLEITEAGMLEVPATSHNALYEGENHDLGSALSHLARYGFEPYAVKPNDHAANEYNIFFCKKGMTAVEIESTLRLRGIHLYDGKHYWHNPSNRWEDIEKFAPNEAPLPEQVQFDSSAGLLDLIQPERRIFWGGTCPPLNWIDASTQLFEPSHDYRMPAHTHQAYDVVYLIERDLGTMKAWPQVLDEALRLLRPQGHLVLRTTNSPLLSIFELMNFVNTWGHFDICHEVQDVNGILQIVLKNRATRTRRTDIRGMSFGVITNGQRTAYLKAMFDSIQSLENPSGLPVEILVCCPKDVHEQLTQQGYKLVHVPDPEAFSSLGWITRKKNLLVARAKYGHIAVAHDRYWFAPDFLVELQKFGGDFSALSCRQTMPDGRRFPDWTTMGAEWSWTHPAMLNYGDWSRHMYINGGLIIAQTDVLRDTPWNDLLFWNQAEDIELTRRLRHAGHVPRFARHVQAITQTMREGFMAGFHGVPSAWTSYPLPGPKGSDGTHPLPLSPILFYALFTQKHSPLLLGKGIYVGDTWQQERRRIKLAQGTWGEITFHPKSKRAFKHTLTIACKNPPSDLQIFINDKAVQSKAFIGSRTIRIPLDSSLYQGGKVCRIQLRTDSSDLRLKSISLSLPGTRPVSAGLTHVEARVKKWGESIRRKLRKLRHQ